MKNLLPKMYSSSLLMLFFLLLTSISYGQITEDFETDPLPSWTHYQTEPDDPGFVQTSIEAHGGTYSFYKNDDNIATTSDSWMVSPMHTCGSSDELKFWVYQNYSQSYYEYSGVWISTASNDPLTNPADFTELLEFGSNYSEDFWSEVVLSLAAYSGQTIYIGFKYTGDWSDELYIDDFSLDAGASCAKPSSLTATSITTTGATLGWTENGTATSWDIEWGAEGFTSTGTPTISATTTNPHSLTGLTANTSYDYYVRSVCGASDFSDWEGPFTFITPCEAISTFPWTEDVESSSTTLECWSIINNNGGDAWGINTSSLYANSGSRSFQIYTDFNSGNNDDYLISPQLTLTGSERMKFFIRVRSSSEPDEMQVLLSTGDAVVADFTNTILANATYSNTTYQEITVDLTAYTGDVYIAFHIPPSSTDGYYLYIDDVTVEAIPSCETPSSLTASGMTASSANIGWTENGTATAWDIEWGAAGFTATGTPTITGTTTNPHSLTGLTDNTSYDYYVRANCGASGVSAWEGPYSFSTLCNTFSTFPFTETFESTSGSLGCWSTVINAGSWNWEVGPNGGNNLNGSDMAFFDDDAAGSGQVNNATLYSPVFDVTGLATVNLSFVYNFRASGSFDVEVYDGTTWQNVLNVTSNDCGAWGCTYPTAEIDITAYSNANLQVRFIYDDGGGWQWYAGIDDVVIQENPELYICDESADLITDIQALGILTRWETMLVAVVNEFSGHYAAGDNTTITGKIAASFNKVLAHLNGTILTPAQAADFEAQMNAMQDAIVNGDDASTCSS